jgi:hypothetical protein
VRRRGAAVDAGGRDRVGRRAGTAVDRRRPRPFAGGVDRGDVPGHHEGGLDDEQEADEDHREGQGELDRGLPPVVAGS